MLIAQLRTEAPGVMARYLIIFLVQCFRCRAMDEANARTNSTNLVLGLADRQTRENRGKTDSAPDEELLITGQEWQKQWIIDNDHNCGRIERIDRHSSVALTCTKMFDEFTASCHAALAVLSQSHFLRRASIRTNEIRDTLLHSAYQAEIALR